MKLMHCPLNGWRNIGEFVYGGDVVVAPAPEASNEEWADWVFMQDNLPGTAREWWLQSPSSYWFIAERDIVNDVILRTYPASEVFAERIDYDTGNNA